MKLNMFYVLIFLLTAGMLFVTMRFFRGSADSTVGIAHSREYKINSEKPALVRSIRVVPGQQVRKGDLLVELSSSGLELDIARMEEKIKSLRLELSEKAKLADSEIAFMKAEQGVLTEKISSDVGQAETELQINRRLSRQFGSPADSAGGPDPLLEKLNALKRQKHRVEEATGIREKDIMQEKQTGERMIENQIGLNEKELVLLKDQRKALSKYASAEGLVENIYVRQGEQVDAFTSLLSIHPVHPTTVIGYLIGRKDQMPVGADVTVRSYEGSGNEVNGKVIGYGAVVELPEILQKSTAVKAFGREIFIEIPSSNHFASGEKVLIK